MSQCKVDISQEVVELASTLTSLPVDVINLALKGVELSTLSILYQKAHELTDAEVLESGYLVVDYSDPLHVMTEVSEEMFEKVQESMVSGRDYLAEEVVKKFSGDLMNSYIDESMVGVDDDDN